MPAIEPLSMSRTGALGERVVDATAALLGLLGFVAGLGLLLVIPFGLFLQITEDHVRVQTRIYQLGSADAAYVLSYLGGASVPAIAGLCLARRNGRPPSRLSLSASAVRFSTWGLAFDGVILGVMLALSVYRRWTWG
jgi:hypothetical protein